MTSRYTRTSCRTADFSGVEVILRQWDEVEEVGSLRIKRNNKDDMTTVFITFVSPEAAAAATEKLNAIKELVKTDATEETNVRISKPAQQKSKNVAADFLQYDSYENIKRGEGNVRRTAAREQRNDRPPEGKRGGRSNRTNQLSGRGGSSSQKQRNGDRDRRPQHQRLPPMEANVAFVDNIPFGTTNSNLMDLFAQFGRVLDINRLELMAMICYDNPESVQQSIQHLNGTKINNAVITVSSGTIRIPARVAVQLGM